MKYRLDVELVRRKLARSREDAKDLVESGSVSINGLVASKVSTQVDENSAIALVVDRDRYVSRGAVKLAGALDHFGLTTHDGKRAIDAGASTGGFTEVLLSRGIAKVYAVDVGYGQLAWSLRTNPQVQVLDRTNIRDLNAEMLEGKVDLIVGDLSFISLRTVMPTLVSLVKESGEMVLMVKPQFEVGKDLLGPGGVVRDPSLRAMSVQGVAEAAWREGFGVEGVVASVLPGPSGNVEYFLWLRREAEQLRESDLRTAIEKGPQ